MAEMLPHVWDTRGGFLSFTSITDISTALMRPRRPKQYCLQLYIYIYIYIFIYLFIYLLLNLLLLADSLFSLLWDGLSTGW